MANGYMPRKDMDARAWLSNFANQLGEQPAVYKVSPAEVDAVREAVDAFAAALVVAQALLTRTGPAVFAKDEARRAAELACRPIYLRVKIDSLIADADKIVLGVRPVNPRRTRIAAPDSAPTLALSGLTASAHILRYDNPGHIGSAKPTGAMQLQLFRALTDGRPPASDEFHYLLAATRNPIRIEYGCADDLKLATYQARWVTRRGKVGPWSNLLRVRIAIMAPARASDRLAA